MFGSTNIRISGASIWLRCYFIFLEVKNNCYICSDDSAVNDHRFVAGRRTDAYQSFDRLNKLLVLFSLLTHTSSMS